MVSGTDRLIILLRCQDETRQSAGVSYPPSVNKDSSRVKQSVWDYFTCFKTVSTDYIVLQVDGLYVAPLVVCARLVFCF